MTIVLHRRFEKQYSKLPKKVKERARARLTLFSEDEFHPTLNNHPLQGRYSGHRSINITGDLRALYMVTSTGVRLFLTIGTHSHLYA